MTRYRFRDLLSGINITKWIDDDPRLRAFRDRIAGRIPHSDPEVRQRKAQLLTERLLVAANDPFALHYLDEMTPHIERIVELREQVTSLSQSLQGLAGGQKLPADVTPDKLTRLFRELEQHMDVLDGNKPTKHFKKNGHEIPMEDVGKLIEEGQVAQAPARKTPQDEPVLPERKATNRQLFLVFLEAVCSVDRNRSQGLSLCVRWNAYNMQLSRYYAGGRIARRRKRVPGIRHDFVSPGRSLGRGTLRPCS